MITVRLPEGQAGGKFYIDMIPWLKSRGCVYTYFSGKNQVVFPDDMDASAFIMRFGGTKGDTIQTIIKSFGIYTR